MIVQDTILIADDEPKIVEVLGDYLNKANYNVVKAYTGSDALRLIERSAPSLVILDLMLPDTPGEEVCTVIRSRSNVPILMLTAKHTEQQRIRGLEIGADDYVTKPFSAKEVVTRVGVILRRSREDRPLAESLTYRNGDLVINVQTQTVNKAGINADLTVSEFKLLAAFARHPRRPFSRDELIEIAFGIDFRGDDRTIDAHVKNIRSKIEDDPRHPVYIHTVYGSGYRFMGGEER